MIELLASGFKVVVLDNLVNSKEESLNRVEKIVGQKIPFEKVDLRDAAGVEAVFKKYHVSLNCSSCPPFTHFLSLG